MKQMRRSLSGAMFALLSSCAGTSVAQEPAGVSLAGRMGERALLMIGGRSQVLAVGQAAQGVRLLRWDGDAALVEQGGKQLRLRVGAAPARLDGAGGRAGSEGAREIIIPVGTGGHFVTAGSINGQPVRFMVDTGATLVAMSKDEAERLGLDLRGATPGMMQTAGGVVPAFRITLQRVRVGEVEVFGVDAVVSAAPLPFVLLGNSFLQRFQMRRDTDVMRLELR